MPRLIVGVLGGLLLGIAGAGLCMLAFGSDSGYWALLLVWLGGIATAVAAPDITRASRWLLLAAGIAILLLVFSSAIVSDRLLPGATDSLRATDHRNDTQILLLGMLLGALALFSGLWIGRDPAPRKSRSAGHDRTPADFDPTAATGKLPRLEQAHAGRPLQLLVIAGALLLVCAMLVWSTRSAPPAVQGVPAEVIAPAPAAAPDVATASAAVPAPTPSADTVALTRAIPAPALTPAPLTSSQARHECMAQIEAARLFLGHARASESRGDYEVKVGEEIARLRRDRPVGPRTLTLIATAMWSRRAVPDPDARVWSREYAQCEQTRLTGSFYVVRGG